MLSASLETHNHDRDYRTLLQAVAASFNRVVDGRGAVFRTDAAGLFELYLDALPAERQVHNCNCCRRFLERFGGLVTINDDGTTTPVMWADAAAVPAFYRPAFDALSERACKARVTSVFYSNEAHWGVPVTGDWSHLAVTPPAALVYGVRALTAGQAMAAARENLRTVTSALGEFKPAVLDEALRLLRAGAVSRAEKFVAPLQWLRDLHDRPKGRRGENLLWRAIATAPAGYCHPRAAVTGSLLEDIAAGLSFETIKAKFDAKVAPLAYQRPKAAPSAGNIRAAEALVEKLGLANSLPRRFARLEEVPLLWRPAQSKETTTPVGVFGHLKPKGEDAPRRIDLPTQVMTWEKFARTVLPTTDEMQVLVPAIGSFIALTTAEHADAPPILKWDREEERNPLAWYVYPNGSEARQWGLLGGSLATVTGITRLPSMHGSRPMPFLGDGVILLLNGCVDQHDSGVGLFPECLKEELHGIRATVEAYSGSAKLGGREAASACGYAVSGGRQAGCMLRVRTGGAWTDYRIDRWD